MKRIFTALTIVFSLAFSQTVFAQCGGNTNTGTQCSPRSGFYDNQYNADLGCGSYRTITNYSPGEYFRMPVLLGGCYTIQTCGSPIDTQISVYQGTNTTTPYSRNDDNGPVCSGADASVIITPNFTDYTRVDVRQYNCRPGGTSSITVRIRQNNNLNITSSSANMCQGQTRSLTATPARTTATPLVGSGNRGTFTGTGVSGTTFTAPTPSGDFQDYTVTYTFGYCTDTQTIRVYKNPTTANAGSNQSICSSTTNLSANTASAGSGQWSVISGSANISQLSNPSTSVTITSGSSATFRWTISNGPCTSSTDDVVITRDNVNPTITCPSNITQTATSNQCNRTVAYSVTAADACGATTSLTSGLGSNGAFPVGTTTESWTATDPAGNTASCSFTVTITDNQNPTIICPANISVNSTAGVCGATVSYAAVTSSDNCPGQTVSTFSGGASGSTFPIGTSTVVLRATDASSNTAQCSFTVTVTDNENPVLSCPSNITQANDPGDCFAAVTWIPATATDNCTAGTPSQSSGLNSGADFPVGTSTVVYTASDNNSNIGTCQFTVTVTDSEDPEITCPANVSLQASSGSCSAVVSYSTPTATDNCSVSIVSLTSGSASGSSFNVGASTVTWTATDAAGRTDVCSFTVTVTDGQDPSISCPSDISTVAPAGACAASVTYSSPVALDNCPGVTSALTSGQISGSSFGVGIN
ncbi:HYR domain-containing protein, partial [bacterium]|nr:HYR domain-containing protein [bacterium]